MDKLYTWCSSLELNEGVHGLVGIVILCEFFYENGSTKSSLIFFLDWRLKSWKIDYLMKRKGYLDVLFKFHGSWIRCFWYSFMVFSFSPNVDLMVMILRLEEDSCRDGIHQGCVSCYWSQLKKKSHRSFKIIFFLFLTTLNPSMVIYFPSYTNLFLSKTLWLLSPWYLILAAKYLFWI